MEFEARPHEVVRIRIKGDDSPEFFLFVREVGLGVDLTTGQGEPMYVGLEATQDWIPKLDEKGQGIPRAVLRSHCDRFMPQDAIAGIVAVGEDSAMTIEPKLRLTDRIRAHWARAQKGPWN